MDKLNLISEYVTMMLMSSFVSHSSSALEDDNSYEDKLMLTISVLGRLFRQLLEKNGTIWFSSRTVMIIHSYIIFFKHW